MRKPLSLSRVVRRPEMGILEPGNVPGRAGTRLGLSLAVGIFLGCIFLSACSSPFGGSGTGARSTSTSTQTLSKIAWCEKPLMIFRDEGATATATTGSTATATSTASTPAAGASATATATSISTASTPAARASTPQTVTDSSLVKANLGVTVYLPTTL